MPYVERVTKAGNTIEIERYFTSRYKKKGISRGDKVKPTKEEQEKVNTRQAERKLRILINANYGYGDYHLVLDYIRRKGEPDRTPEQMRQDIDVFLRECRKEYRKAGLLFLSFLCPVFLYVACGAVPVQFVCVRQFVRILRQKLPHLFPYLFYWQPA